MASFFDRINAAIKAFRIQDQPISRGLLRNQTLIANPRVATTETIVRNPSLLVSRKSLRVFDDMRNDDMVKAAMQLKKQFIVASGWDVESPPGMPDDWEVTEFVEQALYKIYDTFDNSLLQILTALDYGFSVTEKVFVNYDGKLWLKNLVTVAPHDIEFNVNEYGDILNITQRSNIRNDIAQMPLSKFVIFSWDSDFCNPYGNSDLTAAHRPYIMKLQAYNWLALMLERYGIPPIFIHYDQEAIPPSAQAALLDAVKNWQTGGYGLFPRGENANAVDFYTPEIAGQVSTVFLPAMNMFNQDIARALLMPGLLGVTPDEQAGSYARSQTHFDVFMLVIEHARRQLAECVIQDQIIKQLVDLNFANVTTYPKFVFRPISDDARSELLTLWGNLTGQGVVTNTPADEEHIRKAMKFPEMEAALSSMPAELDEPEEPEEPEEATATTPETEAELEELTASETPAQFIEEMQQPRALTAYESKVDFARISNDFDELQSAYTERLKTAFTRMQDAVMSDIRKTWTPTLEYATSYQKLPESDALLTEFQAFLQDGMNRGRASIIKELPNAKFVEPSLPDADLDDALAFLRAKAFWVSGVTDQKILADVRQALLQGVSNGEPLNEIMDRLRDIFAPYVEETRDANGVLLEPARLETIVRTNLTDVYNQGRMVQGAQAEEFLEGWQYSAILDSRTTEVCRFMDGKVFLAGDKRANALRPPRHYNCRSLMVPIVVGEEIAEADKITDEQARAGKAMSGGTF